MSKLCSYKFIIGQNKGKTCQTLLRGNSELCYRHKKFQKGEIPEAKPVETPVEVKAVIEEPKVETSKASPLAESTMVKKKEVIQLQLEDSSDSSDFSDSDSDSSSTFSYSD